MSWVSSYEKSLLLNLTSLNQAIIKGGRKVKKIALYLDGTWNTPEDRTNVFTLFEETLGDVSGPEILKPFTPPWKKPFVATKNFVAPESHRRWLRDQYRALKNSEQIRYYDRGVGTHLMNLFQGGVLGKVVSENIQQAYEFLCHAYQPGDELFIFGFSRGAYAARSLVGLLDRVGLLSDEEGDDKLKRTAVESMGSVSFGLLNS